MFVEFSRRVIWVISLGLTVLPVPAMAAQEDLTGIAGAMEEPFAISYTEVEEVPEDYRRQELSYETSHPPGTLIVDTAERFLYLVLGQGRALRYGIGVGRDGFQWSGTAVIGRKAPWPRWTPPKAMVARDPFAAKWASGMPGGPKNPLGARALYLYANGIDTLFRIHGTNQPNSIGQAVSSGCVRMLNADIVDLYGRVGTGSKVVVINTAPPTLTAQAKKPKKPAPSNVKTALKKKPSFARRKTALQAPIIRKTNFNLRKAKLASR
jgi:lipoprotein-anchoring transpeptidase ErfK/SrfK